ncbi:hypothetical protein AAFC00_005939 [Neodothiora populina]|uniref:Transcription factor Rba50 n=1 Tax=Neodothiora populina TaxID=2781224 RepID=A0ABR3P6F5_9PEZI
MALRGKHFYIDDFENGVGAVPESKPAPVSPFDFIGDVQERVTKAPAPPQPPSLNNSSGGFPAHRKRNVPSRFKKNRQGDDSQAAREDAPQTPTSALPRSGSEPENRTMSTGTSNEDEFMSSERRRIDEENRQRMQEMSPEEIEEERAELLKSLDPSLIQRLLGRSTLRDIERAKIEEGGSDADFPGLEKQAEPEEIKASPPKARKSVKFAEPDSDDNPSGKTLEESQVEEADNEIAGHVAAASEALPMDSTIHFPQPPQPPSLDPSSETFLQDLHEKYFPSLPEDPEKLEWMRSKPTNTYSATQTSLDPKDIRFSFAGALIPPSLAAEIPVTAGLHHHGNAPDAAGYTIPELAILARSTVAAQRCMAFQTLGRLLYRLGKGEFGNPGDGTAGTVGAEDTMGELARSLWHEVERESVIEICVAESQGKVAGGRHVSARAYATEAVWLWQKGGGRRWKAA